MNKLTGSIAEVTPTVCALFDIPPPALCAAPVSSAVIAAMARRASKLPRPLSRVLLYAPDALGALFWRKQPGLYARLSKVADVQVPLRSVFPPVTPVCFASMFTGAAPDAHGIDRYVKPRLACDTLFDALCRAGRRVAIVTVRGSSIDVLFRGRPLDHFSEDYDPQVSARTMELIARNEHDFILAYHQEYDDLLHQTEPFSPQCLAAAERHVAYCESLAAAVWEHWAGLSWALACTPDHGAHVDPRTGRGTHGDDLAEDMEVLHFWRFAP